MLCLILLGFVVSPTLTVRADDAPKERPKGQGGPTGLLTRMRATVDKLNLTTEQKPKVDAAFADAKTKIEAVVKENAGADREAMRGKIQPIVKDLMEKVIAVLTPEQQEELKKARERGRGKGAGDNGKPRQEKNAN
jgi:Spy/CpxP family protein refolding chaperone